MIREKGRPADEGGRLEKEISTYDFLDRLGIPYDRVDHQPAETMEVCKGINEVLDMKICKNLFLCNRQKTAFYLLLMPGDKPFKTKDLSHQLGVARLSFGEPEDMLRLLNLTPGSVSVMGLMNVGRSEGSEIICRSRPSASTPASIRPVCGSVPLTFRKSCCRR